jgi:hypothetical protein
VTWGAVCVWRVAESTWGSKNVNEGRMLKNTKRKRS